MFEFSKSISNIENEIDPVLKLNFLINLIYLQSYMEDDGTT